MNEEALNDAYKHFVDTGYDGTLEDYKVLIGSNPEALQDSFKFFTDTGYDGTIEDFSSLLGVKKKDSPDLPGTSQEDVVESVTETTVEEPISSDSLVSEELISKNEESVVPELQYLYPEFEFEETGFGNYVKITAPNGEIKEFGTGGTDNDAVGDVFGISDGTLGQRTKDIQDFINKNSVKAPSGLNKLENNIKEKEVKFYDKEQYDEYVESYQEDQEVLNLELKLYLKDYYGLQKEKNYFFSDDYKELKKTNPLLADQKLEDFKKREAENQSQQKVIKELQDKSTNQTIEYKKNVGRYIEKESEKGTWYGNILNSLTTGEGGREAGQVGIITDILSKILPFGGMAPEEFDANILEELISDKGSLAEGLGLDPESEEYKKIDPKGLFKNAKDLSYDQWRLSLSKDKLKELKDKAKGKDKNTYLRYAYMDEKYKGIDSKYINKIVTGLDDDLKGDLKSKVTNQGSKDVKATMLPVVRKQLTENFSRPFTGVTEEYSDAMKQTTVGGGVYGAFESVPALIGPGLIGKAANFGFIQTDAIFDEMSRDPSFDEVPESQKYLVTAPLAVVTGILEAYGFRNLTSGSTIVKSLTLKGLKKLGQGTGASKAKTFAEIIQREVKNDIARGTLRVGSAALAEAETGALQEVAEINAKRLWNAASSKGEFDTPEAWSSAYYGQVFKAGLQEAIGGVVLGLPTGISSAVNGPISQRGNSLNKMSDQMYELFLGTTNDKNYQRLRKAQVGMLKEQINAGEITKKEAQEQIDSYDQIVGLSKKINPDLPIQDQKEILSLLYEEQKLTEQLAGKDPRTMPEVKAALDDIQDTITKITDNAISKYQPKGVDVQEQTGDGQKVVEGDTTGPVTNQGKQETESKQNIKEEAKVDPLAINDSDSVKKESYGFTRERIEGKPDENLTIEVVTNKDGSRTFRYKSKDGIYNTEKVSKNNTLTNEQYIEASEAVEPGTINLTETVEGFENIVNPEAVTRRKKEIAEQNKNQVPEGLDGKPLFQKADLDNMTPNDLTSMLKKLNQEIIDLRKDPLLELRKQDRRLNKSFRIKQRNEAIELIKETLKVKKAAPETKSNLEGKAASGLKALYNIQRNIFGLNRNESLGAAVVMDKIIRTMAKRAKTTVSEMYKKIKYVKADEKKIESLMKSNALFQADFSDNLSGLVFEYLKNSGTFTKLEEDGFIIKDRSINDFDGKKMILHQPDGAFTGNIYKGNDLLVEGKGGVYYTLKYHEDGYFWASTRDAAVKMAESLNKSFDANGGKIYMALTSAPYDKLLSSTTMANAVLDFFNSVALDRKLKLNKPVIQRAIIEAANTVIEDKGLGKKLKLKKTDSFESNLKKIKTALGADNSSFGDRKAFSETLIGLMAKEIVKNPKAVQQFGTIFSEGIQNKYFKGKSRAKSGKGKKGETDKLNLKISKTNMIQALSEMLTEPILKEGFENRKKGGQIYAVLELDSKVKAVETGKHESYPFALEAVDKNQKTVINILTDRLKWNEVTQDPKTKQLVKPDRQMNVFPTFGVTPDVVTIDTSALQNVLFQQPLSPLGRLARLYNFNEKGFSMSSNLDEYALRKAAEKLGFGIKRAKSGKYFFTRNDSKVNPFINTGGILFQDMSGTAKGAMVAKDGEFAIYAMTDPDVSTPLHEMAHIFEHYLTKGEKQTVLEFTKQKEWTRDVSETFARGFEKYLADGKAPNSKLERIFIRFKEWLTNIYNGIKGSEIDIKLTPEMTAIYDAMLGKNVKAESYTSKKTTELTELKTLVRAEAKGEREGLRDYKAKAKEIAKFIKGMGNKNIITTNQATVLIARVLKTNLANDKSIVKLIDYINKIYKKADLANKIVTANKLRKKAKKNIKGKIGSAKDLFPSLQKLFNIDAKLIPLEKIDAYFDLVSMFGENAKILTLEESGKSLQTADDILNSIVIEEELEEVSESEIEEDEFDVDGEINEILSIKLNTDSLKGSLDFETAEFFKTLTKEDLENLIVEKSDGTKDYSKLLNLKKIVNNINSGIVEFSTLAFKIDITAIRNNYSSIIKNKTNETSIGNFMSRAYGKVKGAIKGTGSVFQELRSINMGSVDEVLGNYNNSDIAKVTSLILASEYSSAETDIATQDKLLEEAETLLSKSDNRLQLVESANKIVESKYKLMIYALQREFDANLGKKGVVMEAAIKYIDATLKSLGSSTRIFAQADIDLLNKLKEEYSNSDGQIDNNKLYESLSENEKQALNLIDQVNQSLAAKALFTSANVRGNRVDLFNYYTHHDVLYSKKEHVSVMEKASDKFVNPTGSTKAGTLIERTPGAKPLNFDIIASTSRGMKQTIMDYQMTSPVRQVLKTADLAVKDLENDPDSTKIQRESAQALKDALEENIRIVFENNFIDQTIFEKTFEKVRKIGYYAALGSIPRAGAELGSNLFYALSTNPLGLKNGITKYGKYASDPNGVNFLRQVGSSETLKLYDSRALTGKFVDSAVFKKGKVGRSNAMNPVMEKLNFIYENIPLIKGAAAATDFIASNIISLPDKAISRPMYFAAFAAEFEKQTGVSLNEQDLRDIGEGTSKYLTESKEAITNARIAADAEVVRMATSVNPFNSILKLQSLKSDSGAMKAYKVANGYMARFNLFEFITAQKAIRALRYNGDISKKQAVGLLIGITARMTAYMALYTTFASLFDSLFGADDEEEIVMEDLLSRQLIGSISTLMFRRGLGNIPNYPISLGIELLNESYGEDLRGGKEYNRFEHSVVFNILGAEDIKDKTTFELALKLLSGPYGPLLQSTERLRKVLVGMTTSKKLETRQRYLDELTERMSIEAAGNLNVLPFYKDIRRIIVKKFFADKKRAQSSSTSGRSSGYSKEELANLKKYAPQAYRQVMKVIQKQKELDKRFKK